MEIILSESSENNGRVSLRGSRRLIMEHIEQYIKYFGPIADVHGPSQKRGKQEPAMSPKGSAVNRRKNGKQAGQKIAEAISGASGSRKPKKARARK